MRTGERGQATVEFVLVVPLVVVSIMVVLYVAVIARSAVAVHEAAHRAARVASLEPDLDQARQAAGRLLPGVVLDIARGDVGESVRVRARYRVVPGGTAAIRVLPAVTVAATAEMRVEH